MLRKLFSRPLGRLSPGIAFAIAAPLFYSLTIPLSKIFLRQVEPWMLAGLLDLGAGLGMAIVYLLRRVISHRPTPNLMNRQDWYWLLSSIFAGSLMASVLQAYGIANSTAAVASLLLNLEGVFTGLIAWFVFREAFNSQTAIGLAIITTGSVILVWAGDSTLKFSWGALAIVGACIGWATSSNLTHKVAAKNVIQLTMVKTFIGGFLNVMLASAVGETLPNLTLVGVIAIAGFLSIGLTYFCLILALRQLGASRTGAFFSIFPFAGAVLAVITLGESITPQLLTAAALMATGLWFCLRKKSSNSAVG
ncbi:MAG: DMT family transporter [Drouetiella hepatica Uher 2000/2452]|jgi:drug/metabolite transporter (DMT)-like permease|uniref:DMT family transporter n=1 Tax=Drouetiella hepatica Uher 2000/2452 TaxID=904376 RepID=A0A951QI92_9CYAN|nr:DMT family transporter [Drouetiella hepatica Uher 2000/2452]